MPHRTSLRPVAARKTGQCDCSWDRLSGPWPFLLPPTPSLSPWILLPFMVSISPDHLQAW